jgi:DNA-binding GntR family transcriptional regulator
VTPSSHKPTPAEIYHDLRERICLLDLAPGTRLTEDALAREFGVSRTPIRQVLNRLDHERLVRQRAGEGATVATVDIKELRDVWAVRLKIVEMIDEFIRVPAPPAVLDELAGIQAELEDIRTSRDLRALGALYNRYHEAVMAVFSNETLRWIHDLLYHQTTRVWLQFLPEMDLDHELDVMRDEIEQTIDAMQRPTGHALAEVRTTHMRLLLDRFNDHLYGTRRSPSPTNA